MQFQRINRSDPEKVFIAVYNSYSTAAITVGQAVCWDITDADGVSVSQPATANLNLFAGVVESASIAAGNYGLIQIYGFNNNALVDGTTGLGAGDALAVANGSFNIALDASEVTGAAGVIAPSLAALVAYTTGAAAAKAVFIKAM